MTLGWRLRHWRSLRCKRMSVFLLHLLSEIHLGHIMPRRCDLRMQDLRKSMFTELQCGELAILSSPFSRYVVYSWVMEHNDAFFNLTVLDLTRGQSFQTQWLTLNLWQRSSILRNEAFGHYKLLSRRGTEPRGYMIWSFIQLALLSFLLELGHCLTILFSEFFLITARFETMREEHRVFFF